MDKILLGIVCSGLVLLVVAFALAMTGIKSVNPSAEETTLNRLIHPAPSRSP
jgi:hypothetical protein